MSSTPLRIAHEVAEALRLRRAIVALETTGPRLLTNSPSHRANMVDPAFTHVGIGTARGADGSFYAVEIFVRAR